MAPRLPLEWPSVNGVKPFTYVIHAFKGRNILFCHGRNLHALNAYDTDHWANPTKLFTDAIYESS
jgi:hypothetical protein